MDLEICKPWVGILGSAPAPMFIVNGDWNNDGIDDLIYEIGRGIHSLTNQEGYLNNVRKDFYVQYMYKDGIRTGDFNGDGNLDIVFARWGKYLYKPIIASILLGDGHSNFDNFNIPIRITEYSSIADFNQDGFDDIAFGLDRSLMIGFGSTDKDTVFSSTATVLIDDATTYTLALDADSDGDDDLYAATDRQALLLINDGKANFEKKSLDLPDMFNLVRAQSSDFDQDGIADLVSWSTQEICILLGTNDATYDEIVHLPLPFIDHIDQIHIADMNVDGRPDIVVVADLNRMFTFMQGDPENQSTPTPIQPTATPTFQEIVYPTPTPPIPTENAVIAHSQEEYESAVMNSTSNLPIYVTGDEYKHFYYPEKIEHPFSIIGMNPTHKSNLGLLNLDFTEIYLQNVVLGLRWPAPMSSFTIGDANATLIGCTIVGQVLESRGYNTILPGSSMGIVNCDGALIRIVDTVIETPQDTLSPENIQSKLYVYNCNNTVIVFEDSQLYFGLADRFNATIRDCTNLTLEFVRNKPSHPTIDMQHIEIDNSSVTFHGGWIQGWNGRNDVCAEDGVAGITATNNSQVRLIGTRVEGGRGGLGIQPGKDAEPFEIDDTSSIIQDTEVHQWIRY
jgi:hypothetical protein